MPLNPQAGDVQLRYHHNLQSVELKLMLKWRHKKDIDYCHAILHAIESTTQQQCASYEELFRTLHFYLTATTTLECLFLAPAQREGWLSLCQTGSVPRKVMMDL